MERVTGVCMMRNEADVAEAFVLHMLAECDSVLVADNGSDDGTRDILLGIKDPNLLVVDEPGFAYYQQPRMNNLAARAAGEMGATWVVPADADEWWYASAPLREVLPNVTRPVAVATTYNLVPQPDDPPDPNPFRAARWAFRDRGMQKVAFRPGPDRVLAMGNHHLEGSWESVDDLLLIRHLQYRSLDQAKAKLRHGRAALEATDLDKNLGWHWRTLGAMDDYQFEQWWRKHTDRNGLVQLPVLP
jgi:hypothetical protein